MYFFILINLNVIILLFSYPEITAHSDQQFWSEFKCVQWRSWCVLCLSYPVCSNEGSAAVEDSSVVLWLTACALVLDSTRLCVFHYDQWLVPSQASAFFIGAHRPIQHFHLQLKQRFSISYCFIICLKLLFLALLS